MKTYNVYLNFNKDDSFYCAVCPEFFNFILYHENLDSLKASVLHCLKIYSRNYDLTDNNINYIDIDKTLNENIKDTEPVMV